MPAEAASRRQVALLPNLRAHRLAALRGVRAHVLDVRSARQNGCGLAGRTFLNIPSNGCCPSYHVPVLAIEVKYSTVPFKNTDRSFIDIPCLAV